MMEQEDFTVFTDMLRDHPCLTDIDFGHVMFEDTQRMKSSSFAGNAGNPWQDQEA